MTNPTTDLAARFEAKREECWKLAAIGEGRSGVDFWAGGASAFAEARDMARAGARQTFEESLRGPGAWSFERYECGPLSNLVSWVPRVSRDRPLMPDERVRNLQPLYYSEQASDMARAGAAGGAGEGKEAEWPKLKAAKLGTFNHPDRSAPGVRLIGWKVPFEYAGLSDALFALERIEAELDTAAPPPPAQQGSSSPPLTAERGGLELERLSAAATPGEWICDDGLDGGPVLPRGYRIYGGPDGVYRIADIPNVSESSENEANARFIAALVTAYRCGHLVPASLPGGTGSAEEGTGATLAGQATQQSPSPAVSALAGECPSRGWQPIATAPKDGTWIWAEWPEIKAGPHSSRGTPAMVAPTVWDSPPPKGQYVPHWLQNGRWTPGDGPARWAPMGRPPAPCDGSGKAGETHSGSTEGDSAVTEGQAPGSAACRQAAQRASGQMSWAKPTPTPTPDPVGEAKALLEALGEPHCWVVPGQDTANANGYIDAHCCQEGEMSRPLWPLESIRTALATLHASQDQGGEVR